MAHSQAKVLTTRLRIAVALAFTGFALLLAIHGRIHLGHTPSGWTPSGWLLPLDFVLHGLPLILANVAFYCYLCWLGFCFVRGTESQERYFFIGWFAGILLSPIKAVRPEWTIGIKYIGICGLAVALFAALTLLFRSYKTADGSSGSA